MPTETRLVLAAAAVGAVFAALVYAPGVGRGFLKDDFVWVSEAREGPAAVFARDRTGTFYRPLVALSFVADHAVHGLEPRGYGVTNLIAYGACAAVIVALFRRLGLSAGAAAVGALVWAINPHGISMALLWTSGRTSLLMTLFSCAAVLAFLNSRRVWGALFLLGALLAKEDAVALLAIVPIARAVAERAPLARIARDAVAAAPVTAGYVVLRSLSGAITPATAPAFYQLTPNAWLVGANALSYLDRAATGAAVVALAAAAACRRRPHLTPRARRLLGLAAAWFIAGLAVTVWIPVRSSLYVVFPSIGAALAVAVLMDGWRREDTARADRAVSIVIVVLLALAPIYQSRNARYLEPARVSRAALAMVAADAAGLPEHGTVVFEDSPERFSNFRDAFGTLATEAVQLHTGRSLTAIVVAAGADRAPDEVARYRVRAGTVERVAKSATALPAPPPK
jgi:hypothetical protein